MPRFSLRCDVLAVKSENDIGYPISVCNQCSTPPSIIYWPPLQSVNGDTSLRVTAPSLEGARASDRIRKGVGSLELIKQDPKP